MVNRKHFFHFYFFNNDSSPNIRVKLLKFSTDVKIIHREGSVSQIFYLGFSFCFIKKKTGNFWSFLKLDFLDFIKQKLRPKSKI